MKLLAKELNKEHVGMRLKIPLGDYPDIRVASFGVISGVHHLEDEVKVTYGEEDIYLDLGVLVAVL